MKRKILSVILILTMVLSLLLVTALAVEEALAAALDLPAAAALDFNAAIVEISTPEEFKEFRNYINASGSNGGQGKTFRLTADIDLDGTEDNPWTPIGMTSSNAFQGIFDGAMSWAADRNILGGYDDGTLRPGGQATRAEAAAMIQRFAD